MAQDASRTHRPRRRPALILAAVAVLFLLGGVLAGCADSSTPDASDPSVLARDKSAQEIRKLRFETDRAAGPLGVAIAAAPAATAVLATLAFVVTVLTYRTNRDKDRTAREDQQAKDRQSREDQQAKDRQSREDQQAKDRQARFDTLFAAATAQVAASEEGLQAAGAASLLRLQDAADDRMQREIVLYCVTQLRIGTSSPKVLPILREVLAAALRRIAEGPRDDRQRLTAPKTISLDAADLSGIDLAGVNLRGVRLNLSRTILISADMHQADLWGLRAPGVCLDEAICTSTNFGPAKLSKSRLVRARLDGARLASADLRGCDLSGASLRGAALQSAHLDGAQLAKTDFERADINDAYFRGAVLSSATIESLSRATNRSKAHGLPLRAEFAQVVLRSWGAASAADDGYVDLADPEVYDSSTAVGSAVRYLDPRHSAVRRYLERLEAEDAKQGPRPARGA